jgi:hypothetical protein
VILLRFLGNVFLGIWYGYPICCVLKWSWIHVTDDDCWQAVSRGGRKNKRGQTYVPCLIFHQAEFPYPAEYLKIIRKP